jgi:hypothetical protein
MSSRLALGTVLLACAFGLRAEQVNQVFFQIDLVPSGRVISQDAPVAKGGALVFHRYPDGTLMSMRRSGVKSVTAITPQAAAATRPQESVVQIGNLAFQGGAQGGPAPAGAAAPKGPQPIAPGYYRSIVPGVTQGMPNSANDNVIGRTWAAPPGNATQSAPGAPPTNPVATGGLNPPQ